MCRSNWEFKMNAESDEEGDAMKEEARPDIAEQERIEGMFDIGHVKFRDYIKVISEFFDNIVLSEGLLEQLSVKESVSEQVRSCLDATRKCAAGEDLGDQLKDLRVTAWNEFDKQEGVDRSILRVVLIGLYDEESAQYDEEDSAPNFEIVFATLNDVAIGLCKRFSEFLESSPIMLRYKI
jgi:hypothetical protein